MSDHVTAYEGKEPYLFVSYAHRDSEIVLPVIRQLYERKYRVWYDEGIAPGSEWPQNIARHLQNASAVMVFVSKGSLASPNCNNEVIVAADQKKTTIPILLDGESNHPLLSETGVYHLDDGLVNRLIEGGVIGGELIGDGVTGYQYAIDKKRKMNAWNWMLGFAALLAIAVSVSLYGLYKGWFDSYLPAKQQPAALSAAPTPEPEKGIAISSNIIGSVLPVRFTNEEEKKAVYEKLGWKQPSEMTYNDLVGMKGFTQLEIFEEPIADLSFAVYLPDLETVFLHHSHITSLMPLTECPKLKAVKVTADMLPLTIPEERNFEIEVRE